MQRRRLPPEVRREQLIGALADVARERGYAGTTVPLVVARAGLAQGSFYRHFRDLDEAFRLLALRELAPIAAAAFALDFSRARTFGDVERELRAYYLALGTALREQPILVRELLLVARRMPGPLGAELEAFLGAMRARVHTLVVAHMGKGPFRSGDARIVTGALMGMVLGAVEEASELGAELDVERWATEMARFETGALCGGSHDERTTKRGARGRS